MKRRFLLDNDGSNLFHSKLWAVDHLEEAVSEVVRECPPNVTTYLLCSNAGTCYFPTQVGVVDPRAEVVTAALARGQDAFGMLLKALQASGRETFITMRMNDVHNPDAADEWNTPKIRREHPDYVVGLDEIQAGRGEWMSYCLDYSRPEVQAYALGLIRELVQLYGDTIDGIQLDWMRFPRHLPGTPEEVWEKRAALTEFTAQARQVLRQGRAHLQLAARVPPTVAGCRSLGMDLAEWTRQGLVDFLVLCPFLTTNWQIPFDEFRQWLGHYPVPLYGGFDFGYGASAHHPESLRGVCASLYDCGADGIYVFNFPCWTEYLGAVPYHWLRGLDDPATAAEKPLQVSVQHNRNRLGVDGPGQLPATVGPEGQLDLTLYVPGNALPAWRALLLAHCGGDITLRLNGTPLPPLRFRPDETGSDGHRSEIFLEFVDQYWLKEACPKPQDCRLFRADPALLQPGVNHVTLRNETDRELTVERLNLALW